MSPGYDVEVWVPNMYHVPTWARYVNIGDFPDDDGDGALQIARQDMKELKEFYVHVRITRNGVEVE